MTTDSSSHSLPPTNVVRSCIVDYVIITVDGEETYTR
jgi:hypothetical protein